MIDPHRLKFASFTVSDCDGRDLRDTAKAIMASGRKMMKNRNLHSFALCVETSFEDWSDHYHPHLHAIVETAPAGRNYISAQGWHKAWMDVLNQSLRPSKSGAHVESIRDVGRVGQYVTKSPFKWDMTDEQIARTVTVLYECKGIQRFNLRGNLYAAPQY